jgi:hypothetical protein
MATDDVGDANDEDLDPEECERRISAFIAGVADGPGTEVDELAERVSSVLAAAWTEIAAILDGEPHNRTLAVMLLLGQRARLLDSTEPIQWQLHAATSLVSGFVCIAGPPEPNPATTDPA